MGKIVQQLISPTFESSHTITYELSILVGVDSFSFVVLSDQQRVLALRQYSLEGESSKAFAIDQIAKQDKYLSSRYRNYRLAFATTDHVVIPDRLYKEEDRAAYLKASAPIEKSQIIRADHLSAFDTYLIYPLDEALAETTRRLFSGARIFHLGHALLEGQRRLSEQPEGVFFHLLDNFLFASVLQEGRLAFFNTFPYKSAKDFVYFALLIFDQNGLAPERTPVYLSGQLVEASEIYRLLSRYLPGMSFVDNQAIFTFDVEDSRQLSYQYFDLLSLSFL